MKISISWWPSFVPTLVRTDHPMLVCLFTSIDPNNRLIELQLLFLSLVYNNSRPKHFLDFTPSWN